MRRYGVYILASPSRTLYTGVTNIQARRLAEHRSSDGSTFVGKYGIVRVVHCEETGMIEEAIAREKQIKGWRRAKKVALIGATHPKWEDLMPSGNPLDSSRSLPRAQARGSE